MRLKVLIDRGYRLLMTIDGDEGDKCSAEDFLFDSNPNYEASRNGLISMLEHVAEHGFAKASAKWFHEANKREGIYEFVKGDLRLFFFKGEGRDIAVCTGGVVKKTAKANKASVGKAIELKKTYEGALKTGMLEIIDEELNQ